MNWRITSFLLSGDFVHLVEEKAFLEMEIELDPHISGIQS
jgi:hypothetical protein